MSGGGPSSRSTRRTSSPCTRSRREGETEPVIGAGRPGVGLYVRLDARGFPGHLEWFLEPYKEGTVVNAIVNVESARRWRDRRILAVRAGLRLAMVALRERHPARPR